MDESIPPPTPDTYDPAHVPPTSSGAAGALAALLTPEHEPLTFHRPGIAEMVMYAGWVRLTLVTLALAICCAPFFMPRHLAFMSIMGGWKLYLIAIGLTIEAVVHATRKAIAARRDPFCIHCGYSLKDRPEGSPCPECGRPFLLIAIDEYRRDPGWFAERLKIMRRQAPHQPMEFPPPLGPPKR